MIVGGSQTAKEVGMKHHLFVRAALAAAALSAIAASAGAILWGD
jgi:hypothetical protein